MKNLEIRENVLVGCLNKNAVSIKIPEGITSISSAAFENCSSLVSVMIPNSVTSIGNWAFQDCKSLTSITIPANVTSIGSFVFYRCSALNSITIPEGVRSIGYFTFYGCNGLKSQIRNYKAFNLKNGKLSCRCSVFSPMKWSNKIDNIKICQHGYHYCTNLFDIFNYYGGKIDENIAIYECEVGDEIYSKEDEDSQHVTNKIKPVKRLYREDIVRILSGQD